ncbi:YcjF family protein [Enterococcus canintestini]|uniref:GTPase n=1 Tax=Enterococcus canintestini TaxID=317010 RepID=A0A267HV39_9ENTE|nr:GTPase [Enterococcus canintestini]
MKFTKRRKNKDKLTDNKEVVTVENKVDVDDVDDAAFQSFFGDVLKRLPAPAAKIISKTFTSTKKKAEVLLADTRERFDKIFADFLKDVDLPTRKKAHQIIHMASLSAAIIGLSPIPFSDAILIVPVQLVMMARLYKLFGRSWSEGIAKSITKELVVVSFGRSAVGNVLKFIPVAGTISGGAVNAVVAMAVTESLGWVTVKMLYDGEDMFEQVMSFKGQFNTLFKALQSASKK